MNFNKILSQINTNLGESPRRLNFIDKLTWFQKDLPEWDWRDDDIKNSIIFRNKTFINGKLTWGMIIQVNNLMFEDSNDNCPGEVLIWKSAIEKFDFEVFKSIAHTIYNLKGESNSIKNRDEKKFALYLEDELIRQYGLKVPYQISQGLELYVSTVYFQRRHIPERKITGSLFPILYLEEDPMVAIIVPSKFWPTEFIELWKEEL